MRMLRVKGRIEAANYFGYARTPITVQIHSV